MTPKLSVVMPVYNEERYVKEAIESILSQKFSNFEFIIIDDGSIDATSQIISSYDDPRIRFFQSQHKGIVNQLNFGIENSNTLLIARMDADDIALQNRFEVQLNALQQHPEVHVIGTNVQLINKDGKIICEKKYPEHHEDIEFIMPTESAVCHPSVIVKKNVITGSKMYREEYEGAEDHELFLRLVSLGKRFYNIQESLYRYRLHDRYNNKEKIKNQNALSYKIGTQYLINNFPPNYLPAEKYKFEFRMGVIEYYRGSISQARNHFIKALFVYKRNTIKILRYLIITLFGSRIVNWLRDKKYLEKISRNITKLTGFDFNRIRS